MESAHVIVPVNLGERSYEIEVGSGNLSRSGEFVLERAQTTHVVVVTDKNVVDPHAVAVVESLHAAGPRVDLVTIDPGEEMKSVETARVLWNALLQAKADRKTVVVAVGGGVIGDLAGFAAATYARGLRFIQIPTTLLAQVDSSVGGKVGVNLPAAKNMVGAFWQPLGVLIDTNVLSTLPQREYLSGLAEVVKYGVILDPEFFAYLENHTAPLLARDPEALRHVVARSCLLKASVVEQDEREETGLRAVLNYGHTFGHALEAITSYGRFLHGEAISIGMMCAANLAKELGRVDSAFVIRQKTLLAALGLPTEVPEIDMQLLLSAMQLDKKTSAGNLNFILPTQLGRVELVSKVPPSQVLHSLR